MKTLFKQRWFWLLLTLLIVSTLVVIPASRWRIVGWVRGESFFQGRPASYWSGEVSQWDRRDNVFGHLSYSRKLSLWESFHNRFSGSVNPDRSGAELRLVDPEAVPVLLELLADANPRVRGIAAFCLGNLGPDASSAFPVLLNTFNGMMAGDGPQGRDESACCANVGEALVSIDSNEARRCGVLRRLGWGTVIPSD